MGGTKRDFALIKHGHSLDELDDLDLSGVVDNSLIQYNSSTATWEDVTLASLNGQLDHGTLAGLADDDHPQYAAIAQAETITETWTWTDNDEIRLGTGGDLRLYHDGTDSIIRNDTGELRLQAGTTVAASISTAGVTTFSVNPEISNTVPILALNDTDATTDNRLWFVAGNSETFRVLAVNDARSVSTQGLIINRTGTTLDNFQLPADNYELQIGTGADLRLYHDGTNSAIRNDTGDLRFLLGATEFARLTNGTNTLTVQRNGSCYMGASRFTQSVGEVGLQILGGTGGVDWFFYQPTSSNELRVYQAADNFSFAGTSFRLLADNGELQIGAGQDLRLYHDGTNSIVRTDTGGLRLQFSTNNRFEVNTTGVGFNGATPIARPDYTITNPTTNRSIDVSTITAANLAQVVGTMIQDLINYGLYQ